MMSVSHLVQLQKTFVADAWMLDIMWMYIRMTMPAVQHTAVHILEILLSLLSAAGSMASITLSENPSSAITVWFAVEKKRFSNSSLSSFISIVF